MQHNAHNAWAARLRARATENTEYKQKQKRTRTLQTKNYNIPNQANDSETASIWSRRLRARAPGYKNIDSKKQRARSLRTTQENFPNQVTDSETATIWTKRLRARAPGSEIKPLVLTKKTKILGQTKSVLNVDQSKQFGEHKKTLQDIFDKVPADQSHEHEIDKVSEDQSDEHEKAFDIFDKVPENQSDDEQEITLDIFDVVPVDHSKQFNEHEKTLQDIFDKVPAVNRNKLSDQDDQDEIRAKYQQQHNDWEQSPELKSTLIYQRTIDPENIFGQTLPLNIEEIFGYSPCPRSSSANWTLDALSNEEELDYKELMGYIEF
ncbi:unnamed protein product [Rhizophagus irregularis]|nr:unnamed protein product [Rhizophagus irregularis]